MSREKIKAQTEPASLSRHLRIIAIILALSPNVFNDGCAKGEPTTSPIWSITLSRDYVDGEHSGILESNGVLYCVALDDPGRCDQAATLCAVKSSTGAILWRIEIETDCFSNTTNPFLILRSDLLCYRSKDKSLRIVDSRTGKELVAESGVRSVLDILGSQLHALDNEWNYVVIDLNSRKRSIQGEIRGNENTQLTHIGGLLVFFNYGQLSATENGRLLWSRNFDPLSRVLADERSRRLWVNLYNKLSVLDAATGTLLWERDDVTAPPSFVKDKIYVSTKADDSPPRVLELDSATGTETAAALFPLWQGRAVLGDGIALGLSKKPHYSDIALARSSVGPEQAGSSDYRVECSEPLTGRRIWSSDWIWGEYLTKATVSDNVVCVGIAKTDWNARATLRGYRIASPRQ